MKRIVKERWRNYNFQYVLKHMGKGLKSSLKLLKVVNDSGQIVKRITARKEIEDELMSFNRIYYQKAHEMKVHQDKIYSQLREDQIRDKILNRQLEREN